MSERCANPAPIPIFVYQQIAPASVRGGSADRGAVTPEAFARQMRLLRLLGYRGLSMSRLLPFLKGEKHGKVCGITFDNADASTQNHALPVLHSYGFSSTCYAVSQRLGQTVNWGIAADQAQSPSQSQMRLMTAGQLHEWLAYEQEVGAQPRHHSHLPQLSEAESFHEIAGSMAELEDACHVNVDHFCYPYGEYQSTHVAMAQQAGFLTATTTRPGRCRAGDDLWQLPRVPVLRSTGLLAIWWKLRVG